MGRTDASAPVRSPEELEYEAVFCLRDMAMLLRDAVSAAGGDTGRLDSVAEDLDEMRGQCEERLRRRG